jgi:tellurite resistance protein TerC
MKMLFTGKETFEPKKIVCFKSLKIMPISNHIDHEHFFVKRRHITAATPLLFVSVSNGCCFFAIDSVPAILA